MARVPSRFNERSAQVGIAGLGDASPPSSLAAAVFAGNKSGIRHELGWRVEPIQVADFAHNRGGGQQFNAAHRLQSGNDVTVCALIGSFGNLLVETLDANLQFSERSQIVRCLAS